MDQFRLKCKEFFDLEDELKRASKELSKQRKGVKTIKEQIMAFMKANHTNIKHRGDVVYVGQKVRAVPISGKILREGLEEYFAHEQPKVTECINFLTERAGTKEVDVLVRETPDDEKERRKRARAAERSSKKQKVQKI